MPRAPKAIKRPAHRPQKEIDWNLVDALLEAGCPGTEICPHFDLHPVTFYNRVEQEKGVSFTEYSQQKKNKGASELRVQQHLKALGKTDLGDNTLLIFLGKVRLDQRESVTVNVAPHLEKTYNDLNNEFEEFRKSRQNGSSVKQEETNESTGG